MRAIIILGGAERNISLWIVPALLLVLAIIFLLGKGAFLIAGYNTSSKQEKEKYDTKSLCRFMGKVCLVLAAMFSLTVIGTLYAVPWMIPVGISLFFATVIAVIVYANTGNRFEK